jgi:predicted nuclease with TOPRIM domain
MSEVPTGLVLVTTYLLLLDLVIPSPGNQNNKIIEEAAALIDEIAETKTKIGAAEERIKHIEEGNPSGEAEHKRWEMQFVAATDDLKLLREELKFLTRQRFQQPGN